MSKYGYTGKLPTENTAQNNGVFEVNDIIELKSDNGWTLQEYPVQYLVIAGGASGGCGFSLAAGAGGGAGGYRNSYASETSGGNSSTETPLTVTPNTDFTITVGAGGPATTNHNPGNNGNDSVFGSITSVGGGRGSSATNGGPTSGGSGGGGTGYHGRASGTTDQGSNGGHGLHGGNVCGNHYQAGGGGGGASAEGTRCSCSGGTIPGGNGLFSSITGTSVGRGGGGSGSNSDTTSNQANGNNGYGGGNARAGTSSGNSYSGVPNTGGGGGGGQANTSANSGAGGSGTVIVRVPLDWNCNNASGLTFTETLDYVLHEKVIEFTAGTDTVQFGA
jgi:hypothetical protein